MAQKAGDDGSTCASKGRDAKLEHPGSNLVMMMMMMMMMMMNYSVCAYYIVGTLLSIHASVRKCIHAHGICSNHDFF